MKRFLLFSGSFYYPSGGWSDFGDSFDTLEEAKEAAWKIDCDWWEVVDLTTGGRVANS